MAPTVAPGDWLLVDPDAFREVRPRTGQLVVVDDPRRPGRLLVKRVAGTTSDGQLRLSGDHPAHRDQPALAAVPTSALVGRPWLRYWPLRRIARLR